MNNKLLTCFLLLTILLLSSCTYMGGEGVNIDTTYDNSNQIESEYSVAYFSGGCFWCIESAFEEVSGVLDVYSGFSGGSKVEPSYEEVSSGSTNHFESVQVLYDDSIVSYEELVHILLLQIDPTDATGSFVDRGDQYLSAIFYSNPKELELAQKGVEDLKSLNLFGEDEFVVQILEFESFYLAEDYHQNYHTENSIRYSIYRYNSGRDQFLEEIWTEEALDSFAAFLPEKEVSINSTFVKPSDEELKEILTDMQYKVTQEDGTEKSYSGEYEGFYEAGIYVDILSGEPLFSSIEKYDSETGWPSFYAPLVEENIVLLEDNGFFSKRTELRSKLADSHLGHVFNDGPEPTGLRYCINSVALKFVAASDLEAEGYGEFVYLFE